MSFQFQTAVTISLVPEMRGGPFVFWEGLPAGCAKAAELGFQAVEIFAPSADDIDAHQLKHLLEDHALQLAALGTGAGWVVQKLRLTDPDPVIRGRARNFIASMVDIAGKLGAPTIVGSMQGRAEGTVTRSQALAWVAEALEQLAPRAYVYQVPLLIEPLNRYETNVFNSVADTLEFLRTLRTQNVKVLCDSFHMNIEEASIAGALRLGGERVGHVHWADSNRRAAGMGHLDFVEIAEALRDIRYHGYVSAEVLPFPDSEEAARKTLLSVRQAEAALA